MTQITDLEPTSILGDADEFMLKKVGGEDFRLNGSALVSSRQPSQLEIYEGAAEDKIITPNTLNERISMGVQGENLLQNTHFYQPSPDSGIFPPPIGGFDYTAGQQVFLNWFVSAVGIIGLSRDPNTGLINSTSGSIYQDVPKSGPLGEYTGTLVASWGDNAGIPTEDGNVIDVVDMGDFYRVTLFPNGCFSAKMEQGVVASRHEALISGDIKTLQFNTKDALVTGTPPVNSKVTTVGYSNIFDGGGAEYLIIAGNSGDGNVNHNVGVNTAVLQQDSRVKVEQFGMSQDNTDVENLTAWEAAVGKVFRFLFQAQTYLITRIDIRDNNDVTMMHGGVVQLTNGIAPQANIRSNTYVKGVHFKATELDVNSNRVAIDNRHDVEMVGCTYEGFLNPTNVNAWGLLISGSKRVKLIRPVFFNNEQSDIALTDDNEDLTFEHISYLNPMVGGAHLNFEPNVSLVNKRINIIGGDLGKVSLLTNTNTNEPNDQITFTGTRIRNLLWRGANVIFNNCVVDSYSFDAVGYGGIVSAKNTRGMALTPNLINDPYLMNVGSSFAQDDTSWQFGPSASAPQDLYDVRYSAKSRFVRMNFNKLAATSASMRSELIAVQFRETLCLAITAQVDTESTGSGNLSQHASVTFYEANGTTVISTTELRYFMQEAGDDEPVQTMSCFFALPVGAVFARVTLTASTVYNNSLWVKAVTLHGVDKGGNSFDGRLEQVHDSEYRRSIIKNIHGAGTWELPMVQGDEVVQNNELYRVTSNNTTQPVTFAKYTTTAV